jgi:hypothetical protein
VSERMHHQLAPAATSHPSMTIDLFSPRAST